VLAALLLAGCSALPTGTAPGPTPSPPAQTLTVAGQTVPVPPGQWTLLFEGEQEIGGGTAWRGIYASIVDRVVDRMVFVYVARLGRTETFLPQAACENEDYFFQVTTAENVRIGDCWHVRVINLGLAGDPHWINRVIDLYATKADIFAPAMALGVRFIRREGPVLLRLDYALNPDVLLPDATGGVATVEAWSKEAVAADPEKQAVIETLRKWAGDWHPLVETSLLFP
jgi:hypothetical protein